MIPSFLSAIPLPAVFIGTDKRIQGANALAVELHPGADEPRTFVLVFRQPAFTAAVEACLKSRRQHTVPYLHNAEGQETRFDVTVSYVQAGENSGVMACFQDVTQVEQAGEIRRDFVANVSHELKTPLTALLGFIETLRGPAKDDATARDRFLEIMSSEASRMNRLVGDLLSLSRVEEDARMRPTDMVDVKEVVGTVVRNLSEVAKDRDVTVNINAPETAALLPADFDQLTQVFTNLIENGLKYGDRGGEVNVHIQDVERDTVLRKSAISVSVLDNGPGIDPVHIPRLTERFYRIDSHRSREMGGTGLGLAIVKHIVARHRGRMKIESDLGQGTEFRVVLPKT